MAYVPQQAWVQNTTIKDNILFGSNLDNMKYGEVIEACGLGPVLDKIPGRDTAALIEVSLHACVINKVTYMYSSWYLIGGHGQLLTYCTIGH